MTQAVVLTKPQREALTAWCLGDTEIGGRQIMTYQGVVITVPDPEHPAWRERYGPGHAFDSVTYGPDLLIERGVPAEVFDA